LRRPVRSAAVVTVAACAVALTLGGCDKGSDAPSADPTTNGPPSSPAGPSTSTNTSTEPTTPDDPSTPTTSTSTSTQKPQVDDSPAKRARRAQIKAAAFPGFNAGWVWDSAEGHSGQGRANRSTCLHTDLTAIGGVSEFSTTFKSSLDDTAVAYQLTAVFPDEHTAITAESVVTSWQQKCDSYATDELHLKHVNVGAVGDVSTSVGAGKHWLVTYRPVPNEPNSVWFNAEGLVRDGDVITYLVIRNAGQDYNYEPGTTPMELALALAGDALKKTR
jgi:hypothetical protein